jgi:hypothetical protein
VRGQHAKRTNIGHRYEHRGANSDEDVDGAVARCCPRRGALGWSLGPVKDDGTVDASRHGLGLLDSWTNDDRPTADGRRLPGDTCCELNFVPNGRRKHARTSTRGDHVCDPGAQVIVATATGRRRSNSADSGGREPTGDGVVQHVSKAGDVASRRPASQIDLCGSEHRVGGHDRAQRSWVRDGRFVEQFRDEGPHAPAVQDDTHDRTNVDLPRQAVRNRVVERPIES